MPIKKENRHLYPPDWKEISLYMRENAGNKCQACGLKNGVYGCRDTSGKFWHMEEIMDGKHDEAGAVLLERNTKIVLTVAHFDHNPANNAPSNYRVWCQKHHLEHDREENQKTASETRIRRGGQQTMEDV